MNRADTYALMTEYTKDPSLIKHMLAVEAVRQYCHHARTYHGQALQAY